VSHPAPTDPDGLVRRFIALLSDKRIEDACTLVTPDCLYDNVPIGSVRGPEGISSILTGFFATCDRLDWMILHQVSTGDIESAVVLNERDDRFLIGERWSSLPVAGVFTVTGGLISMWRDYFDKETLFAAMAPGSGTAPTD
jgi:limonene-1,2-epoxide hydrolase